MKQLVIFAILIVSLAPFTAIADEKYEVTIRVLEMDEITPDSVINTISLPEISMERPSVADSHNGGEVESLSVQESNNFGDELGSNLDAPETEMGADDAQGEMSSHGNGK